MLKEEIRNKLYEIQDSKYKEFHSSLCPNVNNIVGVQVPKLRKIAKEIARNRCTYRRISKERTTKTTRK